MRFTRRRWDAWCLLGAGMFALGAVAEGFLVGFVPLKLLAYPAMVLPLVLLRFSIPVEGRDYPTIRSLPGAHRELIVWCVSMPVLLVGLALIPKNLWWIAPAPAIPVTAITFWLAGRADRARLSEKPPA
jgi:hypothetical protein